MLMEAFLHTVSPNLQYATKKAAKITARIKNHALDTHTRAHIIASYIQPIDPVQVTLLLGEVYFRLKQCTTWLLNLAFGMRAMDDIQVNSILDFYNQFKLFCCNVV